MTKDTSKMTEQASEEEHITCRVSTDFIELLMQDAELARTRAAQSKGLNTEDVCHDRAQEEE